jgi:hypothetical protein
VRSSRLNEVQKRRLFVALTAGWRKDVSTDPSPPARFSELIDTVSGKQYSESGVMGE